MIRLTAPKRFFFGWWGNICWEVIDSQDHHNHNELLSLSCLTDLNTLSNGSFLASTNLKQMAPPFFFGRHLGKSRAIKQVYGYIIKVCWDCFCPHKGLLITCLVTAKDVQSMSRGRLNSES